MFHRLPTELQFQLSPIFYKANHTVRYKTILLGQDILIIGLKMADPAFRISQTSAYRHKHRRTNRNPEADFKSGTV